MTSPWISVGPSLYVWCPDKEGQRHTMTETMTEKETGVLLPQAEEAEGGGQTPEAGEAGRSLPWSLQRERGPATPALPTPSLQAVFQHLVSTALGDWHGRLAQRWPSRGQIQVLNEWCSLSAYCVASTGLKDGMSLSVWCGCCLCQLL